MKRILSLFSFLCLFVAGAYAGNLNVYASGLRVHTNNLETNEVSIDYLLNAPATTLDFQLLDASTGDVVTTVPISNADDRTIGQHTDIAINLSSIDPGTYKWALKATGTTVVNYTKASDVSEKNQFYGGRGIAVDKSFESDYFGQIYVTNYGGTSTMNDKRTTQTGVYAFKADLSQINSDAYTGGLTWGGNSGMRWAIGRPAVGPDGTVYITSGSATNSGVWMMDPAHPNNNFSLIFGGTRDSGKETKKNGSTVIHNSILHCYVEGTGANRKLYTYDAVFVTSTSMDGGNIYRYDIGNLTSPWSSAPSATIYNDADNGNKIQNGDCSIAPDGNGGWWISQYRGGGSGNAAIPCLIHTTNGEIDYNSETSLTSSYQGGMAVSVDGRTLAIGTTSSKIAIYNVEYNSDNAPSLTLRTTITWTTGSYAKGLAFDIANNLYAIDNAKEMFAAFATHGATEFITPAASSRTITLSDLSKIDVNSVTLNQTEIYLAVNGTYTLAAEVLPENATEPDVTWTTSNSSIATVSDAGVVTANATGDATITATADGQTATCAIHVCAPVAHILPYELRRTDNGNGTYTFTFKSNIAATSGKIIFYQGGVKKGEVAISSAINAGANSVNIAKSALPQIEGVMTWAVELTGEDNKVVGKLSDSSDKYRYYHVRGISANVYPNTEGFGNIYITMPKNGGSDGSCTRTIEQTRGIFQLDAALNMKNPTNAGYTCGLSWPNTYHAPFRAAVGEDGLLYVSGNDESDTYKGVWVLDNPDASSGTFRSVISGTAEQGLCVTGTGSQKKLYTFEGSGTNGNIMEYAIGNNVPYTGAGTVISSAADAKMIFGRTTSATNVAADGNGGLWLYEYREVENSTYVCLSHLNSSGEPDYNSNSAGLGLTNSLRGGFAVNAKKDLIACGTKAKVTIFSVEWNGSGVPVLTKLYEIPISGNNVDGITFDYADNLYVITSTTEYLYAYALPTANNTTEVPAMSSLTVEAFDHIDVSSVTINEGAQSIERGQTFTFSATVLPANASDKTLTWASDNTSVATVDEQTGEVTAVGVGTAHITATADGVTSTAVDVTVYKLDFNVTWVPNGATVKTTAPASNNDLWAQFKTDYNAYYSMSRGDQTIANVRAFLNNTNCIDFISNPASPWCWLGEIILPAAEAAGRTLDSEMKCSFDIYAFFNQLPEVTGTYGYGDYTTAGQPENWLPLWKQANNYLPPTMRATDEMPAIRKGNDNFAGWYDNSSFTGSPVTSVTEDITLYAKWVAPIELDEESADNTGTIATNNGQTVNVVLKRPFEANDYWYTLVLPFDATAEQLSETFGDGYEVAVLKDSRWKSETAIYLNFVKQDYIEAGVPCMFKPGRDIEEQAVFHNVTINNVTPSITTAVVNMIGLYAPTVITLDDDNYYLGATNYLHEYVEAYKNTKGFRAYFHFNSPVPAGCSARVVFHEDIATYLEDLNEAPATAPEVQKVIRDGQLIIIREGKQYNANGQLLQ